MTFEKLHKLHPSLQGPEAEELADALDTAGLGYVINPCTGGIELTVMGATDTAPVPGLVTQLYRLDSRCVASGAWYSLAIGLGEAGWLAQGIRARLEPADEPD